MTIDDVLNALTDEMAVATKPIRCRLESVGRYADRTEFTLEGDPLPLNEHWEEAMAWWSAGSFGTVAAVLPERSSVLLWAAPTKPPRGGDGITFYPPNFLRELRLFWEHPGRGAAAARIFAELESGSCTSKPEIITPNFFRTLRQMQSESLTLAHQRIGYLWGPPGTGKTFTVGALAATIMLNNPRKRIMLVSATNCAVDEALLSVDKRLNSCGTPLNKLSETLRLGMRRYGSRFEAKRYGQERQHLITDSSHRDVIARLAQLEQERPPEHETSRYLRWKEQQSALRARIPKPDLNSPLLAITATAALFVFDELEKRPFDYIIFDEASQLSMPHACALGTLGKQLVFAGDDKQLAPIVQSKQTKTKNLLGCSPFQFRSNHPVWQLEEQDRMAAEICNVVSDMSYEGKLQLVPSSELDGEWRAERRVTDLPLIGKDRIRVDFCKSDGQFVTEHGLRGPLRYGSAERAVELAEACLSQGVNDVAILTSFRLQRLAMRKIANRKGLRMLHISTVHSAQGGEFHTVIFDPVMGEAYSEKGVLLADEREACRLVNLALSRAKARFIVLLSKGDLNNPALKKLADAIELEHASDLEVVRSVETLARMPKFPRGFDGWLARDKGKLCKIEQHRHDDKFVLIFRGGHRQTYHRDQYLTANPVTDA